MRIPLYGKGIVVSKLLFPKLTREIGNLRKNKKITNSLLSKSKIFDIIKDELNLNIMPQYDPYGGENAFISMPLLNDDHPFFKKYNANYAGALSQGMMKLNNGVIEGGFDSQGKAYGFFSEIDNFMVIGKGLFENKFSDGGVAAILCHEIGHFRTLLTNLKYGLTANFLIGQTVNAYMSTESRDERIRLINDFEATTGNIVQDKEQLASQKKEELVTTVLVGSLKEGPSSELNTPNLDYSQCEQAADHFAVACGAETHLAEALGKIHSYWSTDRIPRPIYYSFDLLNCIGKTTIAIANPIVGAVMIAGLMMSNSPLAREYDKAGERVKRMRRALVTETKSANLNKEERLHLQRSIEFLDKEIKTYTDKTPIFELVWCKLTPWGRKDTKQTNKVKLYEELMTNELHIATNALKTV